MYTAYCVHVVSKSAHMLTVVVVVVVLTVVVVVVLTADLRWKPCVAPKVANTAVIAMQASMHPLYM